MNVYFSTWHYWYIKQPPVHNQASYNLCFSIFLLQFLDQSVAHIHNTIPQAGKLHKVHKMVEGVSLLSHESVRLWLDDGHLLSMAGQCGGVQQAPTAR